MSTYKFKRKNEVQPEQKKDRIMNADATPEESTAIFKTPTKEESVPKPVLIEEIEEEQEEVDDGFFNPFLEIENEEKHSFSLGSFLKKKKSDEDQEKEDIVEKIKGIYEGKDMSVDSIKENLASGKKIDLASVFSGSATPSVQEDSEETEISDTEEDTYDLEAPSIEEEDIYAEPDPDEEEFVPEKQKKIKPEKVFMEYESPEDKEEFTEIYRKKGQLSLFALIACSIFTVLLIYLETKSFPHPEWLMPGKFGTLYLLIDLQLVLFTAVCVLRELFDGAKALIMWKPNKNSVVLVSLAVAVLQVLLHLILNKYSTEISLYSSAFALTALVTAVISFVDTRREHISFRVAATNKTKLTVSPLNEESAEFEKFSDYLPTDAGIYKIHKTSFISSFFKTNAKPSPYNETYKIILPLSLLISLVFAILTFAITKDMSATEAISNFALVFMMVLPVSSIISVSLPFFITALRLSKSHCAIIGEASIEEFANTSLVSFMDTDVFHEKGIKITSVKSYGKTRIDNIYLITAKVFGMVGGPLKDVFNRAIISTVSEECFDEVLDVSENGIKALVDSHEVFVGNNFYMASLGFESIEDTIDTAFETQNGRIMYVAIDGEISAKFYIKYALGRKFKALLDSFYDIGICMAINSRDPNLDTKFVTQILKDEDYPIVVVKRLDIPTAEDTSPTERTSSGIVSASSVSSMLRSFISADKLSRIISINSLAKYISIILALVMIVVLFLSDMSHEKISPLFIILYQLIWSLPVIATSTFQ